MSKITPALLILVLSMVSVMGFAQTIAPKLKHPMISDEKHNIWDNLSKAYAKPFFHKTNEASLLQETEIYTWLDVGWTSIGKIGYAYDNNVLVQRTTYDYDGLSYSPNDRTYFVYGDGYLTQEIYEEVNFETGELELDERTFYGYEDGPDGKILSGVLYQTYEEGGWLAYGKDEYHFENGIITEGYTYEIDNSNFIETEKFTVSSNNDTTIITYYEKLGEEWVFYERELYHGHSPKSLFDYFMDLTRDLTHEVFSYPLLSWDLPDYITQVYVDGNWENVDRLETETTYDWATQQYVSIYKSFEYWNGEEWTPEEWHEIHFNKKPVPDSALVKFDFEENTETYMKDVFTHNESKQLTSVVSQVNMGEGLENYLMHVLNWGEVPTSNEEQKEGISQYRLAPAYPNPFNPSTTIEYNLPAAGFVSIKVYDLLGREVANLVNEVQMSGTHTLQFDASRLSSGIYFVRMASGNFLHTRSISLLK